MKTTPNKNRYWLKQHQITAFWHGFGISNGLQVLKDDTKEIYINKTGSYRNNPVRQGNTYIVIKPEYMQKLLKDYITWLKNYKEIWNNEDTANNTGPSNREEFLKDESHHASRADILEMIELLQECIINEQ